MRVWWLQGVVVSALFGLAAPAFATPALYAKPEESTPIARVALPQREADDRVVLSADAMGMDQQSGIFIARGNVEVMQGEIIINARQITYYEQSDLVVAEGDVSVLQPTGDVYFSERAELKDGMKRGVIHQFKARMVDDSVLVADTAVRVNSQVTRLEYASYTPCKLCPGKSPFWQMNARKATVDNIEERVTYRDGFMEMFGVPVIYTPYLSHPTPDARGKSGFLPPSYSTNPYFGVVVKAPYYWRIDEDKDVQITPWMTAEEGPLLQWDYNQLRDAGEYRFDGSVTVPEERDANGNGVGGKEVRGHIFARGRERLDDISEVGFDLERTTDDTYLRRYGFANQQDLFSRAYFEAAQGHNFALAQGLTIQGLRSTDRSRTTPLILPALKANVEHPLAHGATLSLAADALWLTREEGADQQRLSLTPALRFPVVTDDGHLLTAGVALRQDIYQTDNLTLAGGRVANDTTLRSLPQASLEWRYPLIRHGAQGSLLLEPIMLAVAQTNGANPDEIANEDTRLLELNDTNIFSLNRMPGLDLYDSGSRVAYGLRSHYFAQDGLALDALLGQNYELSGTTPFPTSNREGESRSDYIGRLAASYAPISLTYRFGLDAEDLNFNRNEVTVGFSNSRFSFNTSYNELNNNRYIDDRQEAVTSGSLRLSEEWQLYGGARRDLQIDQMTNANTGLIYKNECFNIILNASRSYTRDRDIEPTTEFSFRVGFKNLGEFGGI